MPSPSKPTPYSRGPRAAAARSSATATTLPADRSTGGRRSRPWVRRLFKLALLLLALAAIVGAGTFLYFWNLAGRYDIADLSKMPRRAEVMDMDGALYARLYGENRVVVPLDRISPWFQKAVIAREDTRFYSHPGVDPIGIARAAGRNLLRSRVEGASTLTQQLARNSLDLGRGWHRKGIEAALALRIERQYTKAQILEAYVNRIYYGGGLFGAETASLAYFGKPSAQLTLGEAALLAGIIRSPNRFNPLRNPSGAAAERNVVLGRMAQLGLVTPAEAESAKRETVRANATAAAAKPKVTFYQENYAMDAIRRDLDVILDPAQQEDGGLQIYTTLDPKLQDIATKALDEALTKVESAKDWEWPRKAQFKKDPDDPDAATEYLQGAVVVIENRTGAIRALVGGRDFSHSKYNRALLAKRQVGSAFKPFIYATAYTGGMLPGAGISDGPIQPGELHDANGQPISWTPGNSDGQFGGVGPAESGLIRSRNTMTARVGELVGLANVMSVVRGAGLLLKDVPNTPTIYLGAFETTLKDLTAAYTAFPNNGVRRQPYLIERIDDPDARTVYRAARLEKQMFPPGAAWLAHTALEKVLGPGGTAARARSELNFKLPAAGKTGTTNDFKDAWFVGYTSSLTVGVWVGLDQPDTIMRRGYGATLALPVWTRILSQAPAARYPAEKFKAPEPLQKVTVCAASSQLALPGCEAAGAAYSIELPQSMVPQAPCPTHGDDAPVRAAIPVNPNERRRDDNFGRRLGRTLDKFFGGGR